MIPFILGLLVLNDGKNAQNSTHNNNTNNNNDNIDENSFNTSSTLFILIIIQYIGITYSIPLIHSLIYMLNYEINNQLYSSLTSWLTLIINDFIYNIIGNLMSGLILHLFLQLHHSLSSFYIIIILSSISSSSLAMVICLLTKSNGIITSHIYLCITSLLLLFCGYLQHLPDMPIFIKWIPYLSQARWSYEGLMISAFDDTKFGNKYLHNYGFDNDSIGQCITWLLIWIAIMQFFVLLWLMPIKRNVFYFNSVISSTDKHENTNLYHNNRNIYDVYSHIEEISMMSSDSISVPTPINLPTNKVAMLTFRQVSFSVNRNNNEDISSNSNNIETSNTNNNTSSNNSVIHNGEELIFSNITGEIFPQSMCCIIDATNEGTGNLLLQVLAGCAHGTGHVSGEIYLNQYPISQGEHTHSSAFIAKDDFITNSFFTVKEVLIYASLLRCTDQYTCPNIQTLYKKTNKYFMNTCGRILYNIGHHSNMNHDDSNDTIFELNEMELIGCTGDIENRINRVMTLTGLTHLSNRIIGVDGINGISPSERRCLTIACEIINNPSVIFIQEPFYHLDWYHAGKVAVMLKNLITSGYTVLATMNNNDEMIYDYFNSVLLLNKGQLVYLGQSERIRHHFTQIGN
jgi:energy-coupling factor transporter ATP-binding protein EcfA2